MLLSRLDSFLFFYLFIFVCGFLIPLNNIITLHEVLNVILKTILGLMIIDGVKAKIVDIIE